MKNVADTVSHAVPTVNSNVAILYTGIVASYTRNELTFKM
jgi:hypothetical protein